MGEHVTRMIRREGRSGQVPFLLAERARSNGARSMRAVKGSLGHSLGREGVMVQRRKQEALVSARSGDHACHPPLEALRDDQLEYPGSQKLRWWIPVELCSRLAKTECSIGIAMRKGGLKPPL